MNKLLILFFVLLVFVGCNKRANSSMIDSSPELDLDTLKDNAIYFLDTISANDFFAIAENENVFCNCYENTESNIDDSKVKRNGDVLSFQLQNGKVKELVNKIDENEIFCYRASFDEINQWLVCGLCGDEHAYSFFIDKFNGKETWTVSKPVFSPNKKYFVCYKMNWTDYHTIQLFKVGKEKEIELVWYKLLMDWGANDIRWKDDKTIFIEKESIKTIGEETSFDNKSYVKFPLEKYIN
ncbi:MAG: hypothetical protein ACOYEG_09330 [Petrimonas sp.]|jgi:hypothetical protein|nr:MAG: hypothetical protein BWZ00_00008 [Bacteroidetes bacterium ADurb.BinA174]